MSVLSVSSADLNPVLFMSPWHVSFHLVFSFPLFLFPRTSVPNILIHGLLILPWLLSSSVADGTDYPPTPPCYPVHLVTRSQSCTCWISLPSFILFSVIFHFPGISLLLTFLTRCTNQLSHFSLFGKLHQCVTTVVPRMCSLLILFLESCTSVSLPLSLACVRYSSYS